MDVEQPRLVRGAPVAITVMLLTDNRGRWSGHLRMRRSLEEWGECDRVFFDYLTTEEALDTVCSSLAVALDSD